MIDYEFGISAIDSGYVRPKLDAIHMMVEGERVAIIDSGTNDSVPAVIEALYAKGLSEENVDFVILTHVHLDHAGGAGLMMRRFPNARLVVHPRGVRHMLDPTRLMEGTIAVYGEEAARRMYGELVPIPEQRILAAEDSASVELAGRRLQYFDTPGHARHHICILDHTSRHLFTGDMFGLSYREMDRGGKQFVFPATTPVQFDPIAFHASIDRMMALDPQALYMTHYSKVVDVARIAKDLLALVDLHAALGVAAAAIGEPALRMKFLADGVRDIAVAEASAQGWGLDRAGVEDILGMDIALNAQGLNSWIEATQKA